MKGGDTITTNFTHVLNEHLDMLDGYDLGDCRLVDGIPMTDEEYFAFIWGEWDFIQEVVHGM